MIHPYFKRAFTLVELLIVIAILAILAAAVVIVLNPGEMLAEARDSQRTTDMKALSKSLDLFVLDNPGVSLGTYKKVYISIPDTSATCANITGLPTLPTGWTYNCVTAANLRNIDSTGWLPVNLTLVKGGSPVSNLPTDPKNDFSSFYSYIPSSNTFAVSSKIESNKQRASNQSGLFTTNFVQGSNPNLASIPQGGDWINVPGSSLYGTSDFQVMKYEAKCVDSNGAALALPDSGYSTYSDSAAPCTNANNKYISSRKDGSPIANVTHPTAKTYCASIGAHLLTNEEYMTIARNIEQVSSNWSGGSVGNGLIFSGHNDGSPGLGLQASVDTDGYSGTGNASGTQKRTLVLSNGEVIWDLAGNVREHVQRTSADIQTTITGVPCNTGTGGGWCNYGSTTSPYVTTWNADVPQNLAGPSNISWDANQGTGKIYTFAAGETGGNIFIRGGNWVDGTSAGLFSLSVYYTTSSGASYHYGFRCAR